MTVTRSPREKKMRDFRHNDRPGKPWNAQSRPSHNCESCGAKLYRKGVYIMGYTLWCTLCGHTLKRKYMKPEFVRALGPMAEAIN